MLRCSRRRRDRVPIRVRVDECQDRWRGRERADGGRVPVKRIEQRAVRARREPGAQDLSWGRGRCERRVERVRRSAVRGRREEEVRERRRHGGGCRREEGGDLLWGLGDGGCV